MTSQSHELTLSNNPNAGVVNSSGSAKSTALPNLSLNLLLQLSSAEFDRVTGQVEAALGPADAGTLAQELLLLVACCQRPANLGESHLQDWMAGLMALLQRHPGPVAIEAIRAWPQQPGGRWWPMAADLDALARTLGARHAELAERIAEAKARRRTRSTPERSTTPIGRSAQFVGRVRETHGEPYVRSWLRGGVNALFGDEVVWLTGIGAERLARDCGGIAKAVGVRLEASSEVSALLAQYCDARGLEP